MPLIESYDVLQNGFQPVLIKDSWQVAQLNFGDEYHISNIIHLRKHQKSDRGLSLLVGEAILIYCVDHEKDDVRMVSMQHGSSYNVPKDVWYAIAMSKDSQLFIVEEPNAHREEIAECLLNEVQLKTIRRYVNARLNQNT